LSLVSTFLGTKLKVKTRATTLTKIAFPTAIWKNRCDACKEKNVWCCRKATFHYKGKLHRFFVLVWTKLITTT